MPHSQAPDEAAGIGDPDDLGRSNPDPRQPNGENIAAR